MKDMHFNGSTNVIAHLQEQIRSLERGTCSTETTVRGTGFHGLNDLFPSQGIRQGSLVEWISSGSASGAGTLSLLVAQQVAQKKSPIIIVDPECQTYPPALSASGFDLSRVVIVRPACKRDVLWACEEILRCQAVGLVWMQVDHLSLTAARRLRLAVEKSKVICFLVRSSIALRQSSWAEVRLLVSSLPTSDESPRYRISVAYCQGKTASSSVDITISKHRGSIDDSHQLATKNSLLLVS